MNRIYRGVYFFQRICHQALGLAAFETHYPIQNQQKKGMKLDSLTLPRGKD